jgi:hypothetical protein
MIEKLIKKAPRRVPEWVRDLRAALFVIFLIGVVQTVFDAI